MDTTTDDPAVQNIKNQMEDAMQLEHANGGVSLNKLLNDKSPIRMTRRLILCFMIYFMQMFTGINVIAFYGKSRLSLLFSLFLLTIEQSQSYWRLMLA